MNHGLFTGKPGIAYYVLTFEFAPEHKADFQKAVVGCYFRSDDNEISVHNVYLNGNLSTVSVEFKSIDIDDISHLMQMALHICNGFVWGISIKTPCEYIMDQDI